MAVAHNESIYKYKYKYPENTSFNIVKAFGLTASVSMLFSYLMFGEKLNKKSTNGLILMTLTTLIMAALC